MSSSKLFQTFGAATGNAVLPTGCKETDVTARRSLTAERSARPTGYVGNTDEWFEVSAYLIPFLLIFFTITDAVACTAYLVVEHGACVHDCSAGSRRDENSQCVDCEGPCPKRTSRDTLFECMRSRLLLPTFAVCVSPSVCLSRGISRLRCAKTAEQIQMLFGVNTSGGQRNIVANFECKFTAFTY